MGGTKGQRFTIHRMDRDRQARERTERAAAATFPAGSRQQLFDDRVGNRTNLIESTGTVADHT